MELKILKYKNLKTKRVSELTVYSGCLLYKDRLFPLVDFLCRVKDHPDMLIDTINVEDYIHAERGNLSFKCKGDIEYTKLCEKILNLIESRDGDCVGVVGMEGTYKKEHIVLAFNKREGTLSMRLESYDKVQELIELAKEFSKDHNLV